MERRRAFILGSKRSEREPDGGDCFGISLSCEPRTIHTTAASHSFFTFKLLPLIRAFSAFRIDVDRRRGLFAGQKRKENKRPRSDESD